MKILFNTTKNQLVSNDTYPNGYKHFKPTHIIELEKIDVPRPEIDTNTHKAIMIPYSRVGDTWTNDWDIQPLSEKELAQRDWKHPEYPLRIRVPKQLGEMYPGVYVSFVMDELPIEKVNEQLVDIYANTVQHADVLESVQDLVEIHARPAILE
jgi:hypothetical protein